MHPLNWLRRRLARPAQATIPSTNVTPFRRVLRSQAEAHDAARHPFWRKMFPRLFMGCIGGSLAATGLLSVWTDWPMLDGMTWIPIALFAGFTLLSIATYIKAPRGQDEQIEQDQERLEFEAFEAAAEALRWRVSRKFARSFIQAKGRAWDRFVQRYGEADSYRASDVIDYVS